MTASAPSLATPEPRALIHGASVAKQCPQGANHGKLAAAADPGAGPLVLVDRLCANVLASGRPGL